MSKCFRKRMDEDVTYIDKTVKCKHEFTLDYILEITNINPHASIGYYNSCEYHQVLKCSKCNSFTSVRSDGNYSGTIYDNIDEFLRNNKLPYIYADTSRKCPFYPFNKLINVRLKK